MRASPVLLILLCLLFLAGCQQGSVAPLAQALFPTATPTLVPSPTPTRVDEVVIPFESVVLGDRNPISGVPVVANTEIVTSFVSPGTEESRKGPFIFLFNSQADVDTLQPWASSALIDVIRQTDFEEFALVAVLPSSFRAPSKMYIQRIAVDSRQSIHVHVVFELYSSGVPQDTLPGHIVRVKRQSLPFPLSTDVDLRMEVETRIIN